MSRGPLFQHLRSLFISFQGKLPRLPTLLLKLQGRPEVLCTSALSRRSFPEPEGESKRRICGDQSCSPAVVVGDAGKLALSTSPTISEESALQSGKLCAGTSKSVPLKTICTVMCETVLAPFENRFPLITKDEMVVLEGKLQKCRASTPSNNPHFHDHINYVPEVLFCFFLLCTLFVIAPSSCWKT